MRHTKDSLGNELPKSVFLTANSSHNSISNTLATNSFLLAVSIALSAGSHVVYDKNSKSATITDNNGLTSYVFHH